MRTIIPDKEVTENQSVNTVQDSTILPIALNIKRTKTGTNALCNKLKSFQDKLKQGAKKKSININEAYFENEEDTNLDDYSEEQTEELCKLLDTESE